MPVSNTHPDVNVDEILGLAGRRHARSTCELLVNGAGQGLKGKGGTELAQVFQRFEPTHRDLARVNKAVAVRGTDLRQLVNSLQRLNTALATKQGQIVQLVDSSSKVFRAFASENGNISRALVDLPGTLNQTTATLQKVTTFAKLLGPTSSNLLPAARSLPAANAALVALAKPSTPIVQNQIRPFVVAARPLVRSLKPASINLAKATPNLTGTFHGAQPPVQHARLLPDRHRPARLPVVAGLARPQRPHPVLDPGRQRRLPAAVPAGQLRGLNQIAQGISGSALVLNLTPILSNAGLCPTGGGRRQRPGPRQQPASSTGGTCAALPPLSAASRPPQSATVPSTAKH